MTRDSRWTTIYADFAADKSMFFYIRLTPDLMDLEAAGFPQNLIRNSGQG